MVARALSAHGGAPVGSSAMASQPSNVGADANVSAGISTALQAQVVKEQLKNIRADTKLKKDQAHREFSHAQVNTTENLIKSLSIPGLQEEMNIDKSDYGKLMRRLNRATPAANSASSVIRTMKGN